MKPKDDYKIAFLVILILLVICCMVGWIANNRYMICRYGAIINGEYKVKTVRCLKSEDMSKEIVPTYTSTEYVYPTDTFTPEVTETPTPTLEPYPIWTPEPPYPLPMNWLYWWRR